MKERPTKGTLLLNLPYDTLATEMELYYAKACGMIPGKVV
jgi:hypothetical protein